MYLICRIQLSVNCTVLSVVRTTDSSPLSNDDGPEILDLFISEDMLLHSILLLVLPRTLLGGFFFNPFRDFIQCRLCQSVRLEGLISDCSCDFRSVDKSVNRFFSPLLENITSRTFFRYFRVNLEQPCPFWQEDGKCMMESCSVCTCEENEVPESWMKEGRPLDPDLGYEKNSNSFGWITSPSSAFGYTGAGYNNILGRLNMPATAENARDQQENGSSYLKYLKDIEDDGKLLIRQYLSATYRLKLIT